MKSNINLHIHSNYSDGELSVKEIVDNLKNNGVKYFSITDHDDVQANEEAALLAKENGLKYITGIELTCNFCGELDLDESYTLHIIGLGINYWKMKQFLKKNQLEESKKLLQLFTLLKEEGYSRIQIENIVDNNGLILRRTAIAKELMRQGYFLSTSDAFKLLLDKPIYQKYAKKRFSLYKSIEMIHNCNGMAIWAHPFFIRRGYRIVLTEKEITNLLFKLVSYGIDGIESYYLGFNKQQVQFLHNLAQNNNLFESIGTDYHGVHSCQEGIWQKELVYSFDDKCEIDFEVIKRLYNVNKM